VRLLLDWTFGPIVRTWKLGSFLIQTVRDLTALEASDVWCGEVPPA
jgi:hypothetical protein